MSENNRTDFNKVQKEFDMDGRSLNEQIFKKQEMKVINTYIVDNDKYSQKDILFECARGKWFYQTQVLQQSWETVVLEVDREKAQKLLNN